jgi:hypothetical protein
MVIRQILFTCLFAIIFSQTLPYTCKDTDRGTNIACAALYQGVCGLYKSTVQCIKAPCGITSSTACTACANPDVEQVIAGECEKQLTPPTTTYCSASQRNQVCTMEYLGVCGFYKTKVTCDSPPCMQTFGTICTACANPYVDVASVGECPSESKNVNTKDATATPVNDNTEGSYIQIGLVYLLGLLALV